MKRLPKSKWVTSHLVNNGNVLDRDGIAIQGKYGSMEKHRRRIAITKSKEKVVIIGGNTHAPSCLWVFMVLLLLYRHRLYDSRRFPIRACYL